MKRLLLIFILLNSLQLFSQNEVKKLNYLFGVGIYKFNIYQDCLYSFENEINLRINDYFSSSFSLNYGKSFSNKEVDRIKKETNLNCNINFFISPFKNTKKNNFRIGTGVTYTNWTRIYSSGTVFYHIQYENGEFIPVARFIYNLQEIKTIGLNFIIEDTYLIKDKFLIGFKAYNQFLKFDDDYISIGLLLKIGVLI